MIEEILRAGMKIRFRQHPVVDGNRHAVFLLNVALAFERQEPESLAGCILQQRAGHGIERRWLIEIRVSGAQDPVKLRQLNGCAHPRIGSILVDLAREMCQANTAGQASAMTLL